MCQVLFLVLYIHDLISYNPISVIITPNITLEEREAERGKVTYPVSLTKW